MKTVRGQVLINAVPGQVGPSTHMDGLPTYRELTKTHREGQGVPSLVATHLQLIQD
jgi:hypothetical protein